MADAGETDSGLGRGGTSAWDGGSDRDGGSSDAFATGWTGGSVDPTSSTNIATAARAEAAGFDEDTNFLQDLLGISETLDYNPATEAFETRFTKTVSPTSIALGLAGPAGLLASAFAKQIGVDDPLSFDVDLGFLSDEPAKREKKDRDGRDEKKETLQFAQNDQLAPGAVDADELAFGDKVAQIMEQTQFEFGAMPDFSLLNNVFGTDLAALVDKTKKA